MYVSKPRYDVVSTHGNCLSSDSRSTVHTQYCKQLAPASRVASKPEILRVPETPLDLEEACSSKARALFSCAPGSRRLRKAATTSLTRRTLLTTLYTLTSSWPRSPGALDPGAEKKKEVHTDHGAAGPVRAGNGCPQSSGPCAVAHDFAVEKPENGLWSGSDIGVSGGGSKPGGLAASAMISVAASGTQRRRRTCGSESPSESGGASSRDLIDTRCGISGEEGSGHTPAALTADCG